uniref:VPS10 domain-containing protein n=1 Tax=Arcella intermedia TaxID=1963864 RepID=A0A6B2KYL7_9EUKA
MDVPMPIDDYQIYYVSNNHQVIFIRTIDGHIYRSGDEGATWEKQTDPSKMPNFKATSGISSISHTQVKDGTIVLYFLGSDYSTLWVSVDAGLSYTYCDNLPSFSYGFQMHPMYPGFVLSKRSNNGNIELWVGKDNGKEWDRLLDGLTQNSQSYWSIFPTTDPNRIYVTKNEQLLYSDDFFVTSHVIPLDGKRVLAFAIFEPNKFVVKTCADVQCIDKELYISEDGGKEFTLAEIPERDIASERENDFLVWELSDSAIWLYVDRGCVASNCWGDMFHSNSADTDFTLSLPYTKRGEFTKYNSVDGIYLANQYITKSSVPESAEAVRSLITFNKGGDWNLLRAPEFDANGQPTNCHLENGCSLHVHGWGTSSSFTYFYSVPNAVGLMVASGNIGTALDNKKDKIATYISFNGGVKWTEVKKKEYVPEIADSGAIIVMVVESGETNEISYTIDNGNEWRSCIFTEKYIDISNIRTAPGWTSRKFLMYGQRTVNGAIQVVIYQISFDEELPRICSKADFTTWSPTTEHGNCVLGKATYYNVRNQTCSYGTDYKPTSTFEKCACTEEDYECDYCFSRSDLNSRCTMECRVSGIPAPPSNCTDFYEVDMGYRKVDGDLCDFTMKGSVKPKGLVPCVTPSPPHSRLTGGLGAIPIIIIVSVILAIVVGIAIYVYKNNDGLRQYMTLPFQQVGEQTNFEQGESLVEEK